MVGAASAYAQSAPAPAQEIVVTGSRLNTGDTSASPVATITQEEYRLRGAVNAENLLSQIPQVVGGFGSTTNNGGDGSATVNLRGLGDQRSLVLVDGKRFIPRDETGVTDLNTIPVALIARTDVVTGGASAVYGSDAIAGVVNFILRDDFEGVQLDSQYSVTGEGDGETVDLNLLMGLNTPDGRGNVTLYAGYTQRETIFQGDRDYSRFNLTPGGENGDQLVRSGSANAFPGNVVVTDPTLDLNGDELLTFDAGGNLVDAVVRYNFNPINYLQVPQERFIAGALGKYALTGAIEAYGRVAYANNVVDTQIAPTATFFEQLTVNPDNPFLTPATRDALLAEAGGLDADGNIPFFLGRRLVEGGGRFQSNERSSFDIVGGVRGDIVGNWKFDGFVQKSRTTFSTSLLGDITLPRVQQSLLAVAGPGGPACIDPSGGCAPANFFSASPGALTPAAIDFISLNLSANGRTDRFVSGLGVTGDLGAIKSPFAESPIGVAFGVEYREEKASYRPDANYAGGNAIGFGNSPAVAGEYDVKEGYVEVSAPILENLPFIYALTFEGGYRRSSYSNNAGDVDTFKYGAVWSPTEDLRLRGLFQRAVRAPSISELFSPQAESADSGDDPCAGSEPTASQALCEATGVPVGRYGSVPTPPAGQYQAFLGGNPDLKAETADTYTFGFVYRPSYVPNLVVSVDYFSIEVADAITVLAGGSANVLDACYNVLQDPASVYCQGINRNAINGALFGPNDVGVSAFNANIGELTNKGFDIGVRYGFDLANAGKIDLDFAGTVTTEAILNGGPGLPVFECEGTWGFNCGTPQPEFKAQQRVTWSQDKLSVSGLIRYIGPLELDAIRNGGADGVYPVREVNSETYVDLSASYDLNDNVNFRIGATNLFDNDPPVFGDDSNGPSNFGSANTFPSVYDPLGRVMFVGVSLKR